MQRIMQQYLWPPDIQPCYQSKLLNSYIHLDRYLLQVTCMLMNEIYLGIKDVDDDHDDDNDDSFRNQS